ncbi:hypothetical protein FA743_00875 [Paracoccus gahaiensis]|uniref:Uncharacterized protein n=1 Tax=Paracoccus gahaiensis TaxID=1706839 RepID=A0A4U0REJ7_9RHOB|nr:hypothetical protein [Paracoccus gahaiensis]TJZ93861.1 hypothetical protein FA743_00875 [Paracoccus gahaiensis]
MNDQTWNDPGALASASEVDMQSGRDCSDNTLNRVLSARDFSEALVDCDPEDRLDLLEDAHEFLRAGFPMVLMGSIMEQATFWADRASRSECKAYGLACFNRLSLQDQEAFLNHVRPGRAHE